MTLTDRTDDLAYAGHESVPPPVLSWADGRFFRAGVPHRILSGSMHYFRVHPDLWRDRLERIAALGLNTVDTYVAWNFHERHRGEVRWDGWRDLERFIGLAAEVGLDVIVRPGPYICAEWDNGGFPAWLTGTAGIGLRSSDPVYLDAVETWFGELLPRIAPLQAAYGGPIVAVQLENEYGSYGDDRDHLRRLRGMLLSGGICELLYTADGPTDLMLDAGTVDGTLATATFGSRATHAADMLRARRPGEPFMCAEFWNGWFDHWGGRHHVRSPEGAAATVAEILDQNGSVSIYMAHGGTNFGLWSGANHDETRLTPTQTSYDSDAPIAEDGTITDKFWAIRTLLVERAGAVPVEAPPPSAKLASRSLPVTRAAGLLAALSGTGAARRTPHPPSFEELGLDAGLVLYRATPILPAGDITLRLRGLCDHAVVLVDGVVVGSVDGPAAAEGIMLRGDGRMVELEILVENDGRINYGPRLGEGKGILGGVQVERRFVNDWTAHALPIDQWSETELAAYVEGGLPVPADAADAGADAEDEASAAAPGFATAVLDVPEPADAFLAFPGFGRGFAWVNGFLLGRYRAVGPQVTYYVPAPMLRPGRNVVTVLELDRFGSTVEVRDRAELGPEEEHVETFG